MFQSKIVNISALGGRVRIDTADSLSEVVDHADKAPGAIAWHAHSNSDVHKFYSRRDSGHQREWFGTRDFGQTLKLAREGWPEGRASLASELDAASIMQLGATVRAECLDVAGSFPLVPAAVAGDPLNMFTIGLERAKTRPIFRFLLNVSLSSGVPASKFLNRGAAVLSWVDKLENEGARCEIYAISTQTKNSAHLSAVAFYCVQVCLKRADEPLDIDRMAFAMLNASMQRRLIFSCMEKHADMANNFSYYGTPSDKIPDELKIPHSLYFDCLHLDKQNDFGTLPRALAAVERLIARAQIHDDMGDAA